ncbi:restriction endonuclease subunit S [Motilimonas sp. 1_MG-2023]|uniref:restriction endonuclease subunit S n=1 Tax=Motilimonas sp. 1_MG-2023 TaxID=3062672 RepID=UPI0026E3284F|nr:restriction endonuclease subunit S [Motilimonas sp. 1_MG-2023]MDO6526241.1 restriction endonuclease subunit S [Motilimonas sp. 1_MG-2023]
MNKPTEKGLVPELRFPEFKNDEEWKIKELSGKDVAIFVKDREPLDQLKLNSYVSTENLLADYAGVAKASKLPPSGSFTSYKPNDVLISNIRPYLKKVWCADKVGAASNDVIVIRPSAKVSAAYMLHTLKNDEFINFVMKGAKGVKMPRGDIASIKAYPVALPRLLEQQKIADCLSSHDELVSANSQKLDALKAHKKGLMQQLFPAEGETIPKLRFPEFEKDNDWVEQKFGNITNFASGGTPSKNRSDYWDGEIPWISAASMHDILIESSDRNITKIAVEDGAKLVSKGTLLLLVRGSMLHKRIPIGITQCEVAFNQDVKALMLKKKIHTPFLLYLLIACEMRLLSAVTKTGIGAGKLDTNDLQDFLICIPRRNKEQKKIADCLSKLDELITAQSQKIDVLKTHKKGLMQQLFPSIDEVHMGTKAEVSA